MLLFFFSCDLVLLLPLSVPVFLSFLIPPLLTSPPPPWTFLDSKSHPLLQCISGNVLRECVCVLFTEGCTQIDRHTHKLHKLNHRHLCICTANAKIVTRCTLVMWDSATVTLLHLKPRWKPRCQFTITVMLFFGGFLHSRLAKWKCPSSYWINE